MHDLSLGDLPLAGGFTENRGHSRVTGAVRPVVAPLLERSPGRRGFEWTLCDTATGGVFRAEGGDGAAAQPAQLVHQAAQHRDTQTGLGLAT
jgi:hypothetical protein